MDELDRGPYPHLACIVNEALSAQFSLLLQQGVRLRCRVGCSIEAFLRQELGASPGIIEQIQSIMLDGKPVDDIGSSLLHEGSTLALSAAMPGLVGATLRRGGAYSSLRSGITYHETGPVCDRAEGWICIKIFNLLMSELGPGLLQRGVLVKATDLTGFLAERSHDISMGCRSVAINGISIDIGKLNDAPALNRDWIFLTVTLVS